RRTLPLAVQVEAAAVADVDQAGRVVGVCDGRTENRCRRTRGDDLDDVHARDTTVSSTTEVERVLVLGVTSSIFTRDELADAFATFEQTVDRAAQTRDWDPWVEQYTSDIT